MIPDGILEGAGATGTCTPSRGVIAVDGGQTPTQQGDTVCHEVTHGWLDMVKLDDEVEEAICRIIGPMMFAFIRDNPKFIDWIRSLQ